MVTEELNIKNMIKKRFDIDTKNTIWARTYIEMTAETEQEIQQKIENFDFSDSTSYTELSYEYLLDTIVELPLSENQYSSTMELFKYPDEDEDYQKVKDNLNDIEPEDVKMFSITDLRYFYHKIHGQRLERDYPELYEELLKTVKS